jgi:secondary thiamine-phosphate synthase enzyme
MKSVAVGAPAQRQVLVRTQTRERASVFCCEPVDIETTTAPEFVDITEEVVSVVAASGVHFGQAAVYSTHTTAAIKINENEPLLLQDMARALDRASPCNADYHHNDFSRRTDNMDEDECPNGHAHCQHLFLSTSETVPILEGSLALGQWQRIFLVELDRPKRRRVLVTVLGVGKA